MNALLIYPRFPDTFLTFKHALKFIGKRASIPPLGLITIAGLLPDDWSLRLIDTNVTKITKKDLAWADIALISGMIVQGESIQQIVKQCKLAGVKIVAGGPIFMDKEFQYQEIDHFVLNEAELTLPMFLEDFKINRARHIYTTTDYADLRKSPSPRWDLLMMDKYANMSIQISRGCPYDCEFCNIKTILGNKPRVKTIEQVLTELDQLYELGWRGSIFIADDNLIGNKRYFMYKLLPRLIDWREGKPSITFFCELSLNIVDDEQLITMMVKAGFSTVFIGIETPEEESLIECNKDMNLYRDLVENVKYLQHNGLQVQAGFIVGFDHDTTATFSKLIDIIQKTGIITAIVGLLQAPPGTKLYERLKESGRLRDQTTGSNTDGNTNIVPLMGINELLKGYKYILRSIFSSELYYQRVKTFLLEYRPPHTNVHFKLGHVLAFVRSLLLLGIVDKDRNHYSLVSAN